MEIVLDIPEDRRSLGSGRLCLLMGLTGLLLALTILPHQDAGPVPDRSLAKADRAGVVMAW